MNETTIPLFEDVRKGLESAKLVYEQTFKALNYAVNTIGNPETIVFVDDCLAKIVSILLAQNPSSINPNCLKFVENSLSHALTLILWKFADHPFQHFNTLQCLFDKSLNYYIGRNNQFYSDLINRFISSNSLRILAHSILSLGGDSFSTSNHMSSCVWNGSVFVDALTIYVDRLKLDYQTTSSDGTVSTGDTSSMVENVTCIVEYLDSIMHYLNQLHEVDWKKESMISLKRLMIAMNGVYSAAGSDDSAYCLNSMNDESHSDDAAHVVGILTGFHQRFEVFWLAHTLRLLNCQSIVLRLFGWEQLQDMVFIAVSTRPYAASYLVCNSGYELVNGVYVYVGINSLDNVSPRYEKVITPTLNRTSSPSKPSLASSSSVCDAPTDTDEDVDETQVITLFRCTMKNNQKWWFLSRADKESPGTDKDIDYYNRQSTSTDNDTYSTSYTDYPDREPPLSGWATASVSPACDPLPTIYRVGVHIPEGISPDFYFIHKLTAWVHHEHIIHRIFDQSSLHREIIGRCGKLVLFLVEMDLITREHIQLMWQSAMSTPDADCMSEIFHLLAAMSCRMTIELFDQLLVTACYMHNLQSQLSRYYSAVDAASSDDASGIVPFHSPGNISNNSHSSTKLAAGVSVSHFLSRFCTLLGKYNNMDVYSQLSLPHYRSLFHVAWFLCRFPMIESVKSFASVKRLLNRCVDPCNGLTTDRSGFHLANRHFDLVNYRQRHIEYKDAQVALIVDSVNQCSQVLTNYSAQASSHKHTVREIVMGRMVAMIQYMCTEHINYDCVQMLMCAEFGAVMTNEVIRYCTVFRNIRQNSNENDIQKDYAAGLTYRIELIRSFYNVCEQHPLPLATIKELWSLLNSNWTASRISSENVTATDDNLPWWKQIESKALFSLLTQFVTPSTGTAPAPVAAPAMVSFRPGARTRSMVAPEFGVTNNRMSAYQDSESDRSSPGVVYSCSRQYCVYIYAALLCNPNMNWVSCGKYEFDCFKTYFDQFSTTSWESIGDFDTLDNSLPISRDVSLHALGVRTLWQIFYDIRCNDCAEQAKHLILQVTNSSKAPLTNSNAIVPLIGIQNDHGNVHNLLATVFHQLRRINGMGESHGDANHRALLSRTEITCIERCISLLKYAVTHSFRSDVCTKTTTPILEPIVSHVPAHGVRGCNDHFQLVIHYCKLTGSRELTSALIQSHSLESPVVSYDIERMCIHQLVKESSGFTVCKDVLPMHTLLDVKMMAGEKLKSTDWDRMFVVKGKIPEIHSPMIFGHGTLLQSHGFSNGQHVCIILMLQEPAPAPIVASWNYDYSSSKSYNPILYGSTRTLDDLSEFDSIDSVASGQTVIKPTEKSRNEVARLHVKYLNLIDIGQTIMQHPEYFTILKSIASQLLVVSQSSVIQLIYSLLVQIPTDKGTMNCILNAVGIDDWHVHRDSLFDAARVDEDFDFLQLLEQPVDAVDWDTLLNPQSSASLSTSNNVVSNTPQFLYNLQIISFLLCPSQAGEWNSHSKLSQKCSKGCYGSILFKHRFVESGGFIYLLRKFTDASITLQSAIDNEFVSGSLFAIMHVLHFILFHHQAPDLRGTSSSYGSRMIRSGSFDSDSDLDENETSITAGDVTDDDAESVVRELIECCVGEAQQNQDVVMIAALLDYVSPASNTSSCSVISRLLQLAGSAANTVTYGTVKVALNALTFLLNLKDVHAQLVASAYSKIHLSQVCKSLSKPIRLLGSKFAIQLGKCVPSSAAIVFGWLLWMAESLLDADDHCIPELFTALKSLLVDNSNIVDKNRNGLQPVDQVIVDNRRSLSVMISRKLDLWVCNQHNKLVECNQDILTGYLQLLHSLILVDMQTIQIASYPNINDLIHVLLTEFLFPTNRHGRSSDEHQQLFLPICKTSSARLIAFSIILACIKNISELGMDHSNETKGLTSTRSELIQQLLTEIQTLICPAVVKHMKKHWKWAFSHDMKLTVGVPSVINSPVTPLLTGLKNQGCTCYLNSLIQQLYMNVSFREAILLTPILECHRMTLWHKSNDELLHVPLLIERQQYNVHENKPATIWSRAKVVKYEADSDCHVVEFINPTNGQCIEQVHYNIREGRDGLETGRVRLANLSDANDHVHLSPQEQACYCVLSELQRAFMYLSHTSRRYFDPKLLVESCKSLNMTFDVFQQNDASEFCDQLLDRLETAMKGKHTGVNVWSLIVMKYVFGGTTMTQKLPKDCPAFNDGREQECGQWLGSREEDFMHVELTIRGKDSIDDSLSEMIRGEVFDGDNKIMCDTCGKKEAVTRRQVLSTLPNSLVLHLKRFDLDFTTFETLKLNNRVAFETKLNVFPFAKEGLALVDSQGKGKLQYDERNGSQPPSPTEAKSTMENSQVEKSESEEQSYEYQLQGILVHAGTTQGGHYYSFIRTFPAVDGATESTSSNAGSGQWYKFDDDEVTLFDPKNIPYECFGGSSDGSRGSSHKQNSSNALMLFYTKVNSANVLSLVSDIISKQREQVLLSQPRLCMLDGYEAFRGEVLAENQRDQLLTYALDQNFHVFIKTLISSQSSIVRGSLLTRSQVIPSNDSLSIFKYSCHLLFDVMLHSRERLDMQNWERKLLLLVTVDARHSGNDKASSLALWFLVEVLDNSLWMTDYMLDSTDPLARNCFVRVFCHCVLAIVPVLKATNKVQLRETVQAIMKISQSTKAEQYKQLQLNNVPTIILFVLNKVSELLKRCIVNLRIADEVLTMVRTLSSEMLFCQLFLSVDALEMLMILANPEDYDSLLSSKFDLSKFSAKSMMELQLLKRYVYETVAAVLGVAQRNRVDLLTDQGVVDNNNNDSERNSTVGGLMLPPRSSTWDPELTAEAMDAFRIIFWDECTSKNNSFITNHGWDIYDFMRYLGVVSVRGSGRPTMTDARQVMERYDNTAEGRLTINGYLSYCTDLALNNSKLIWKDLYAYRFENDLTRTPTAVSSQSIHDVTRSLLHYQKHGREGNVDPEARNLVGEVDDGADFGLDCTDLLFSETVLKQFRSVKFFETGLHVAESAIIAITKQLCLQSVDMSLTLINMICTQIYALTSNADNSTLTVQYGHLLNHLVSSMDTRTDLNYLEVRLEEMLFGEVGFMHICMNENFSPSRSLKCNQYNANHLATRYFQFCCELCDTLTFVGVYIRDKLDQWTQQQLVLEQYRQSRLSLGEMASLSEEESEDNELLYINTMKKIYFNICQRKVMDESKVESGGATSPVEVDSVDIPTTPVTPRSAPSRGADYSTPPKRRSSAGLDDSMDPSVGDSFQNIDRAGAGLFSSFTIIVDDAGAVEVNGLYEYFKMIDGVASFVKYINNEDVDDPNRLKSSCYCIYRALMEDQSHQWYISCPPRGQLAGTVDDVDYYFSTAQSKHEEDSVTHNKADDHYKRKTGKTMYDYFMPPRSSWECCSELSSDQFLSPAPFIMYISSLSSSLNGSLANTPQRSISGVNSHNRLPSVEYSPISPAVTRKPPLNVVGRSSVINSSESGNRRNDHGSGSMRPGELMLPGRLLSDDLIDIENQDPIHSRNLHASSYGGGLSANTLRDLLSNNSSKNNSFIDAEEDLGLELNSDTLRHLNHPPPSQLQARVRTQSDSSNHNKFNRMSDYIAMNSDTEDVSSGDEDSMSNHTDDYINDMDDE